MPTALLPNKKKCNVLIMAINQQEKRYRSMQEHIRRAHPEHYIPKLPATEESFLLMINSPPQERPNDQSPASATQGIYLHLTQLSYLTQDTYTGFKQASATDMVTTAGMVRLVVTCTRQLQTL